MKLDALIDFATEASEAIGKFKVDFMLPADQLPANHFKIGKLDWSSISYGDTEINQVPDDKRGVYAFAVCKTHAVLPPHGYVLYIGIAGRDSKRSLRDRYRDYLNEKKVLKRARIARMIGTWHPVLRFFFAPVDDAFTSAQLMALEKSLNGALMPPFSEGDLEADIKKKRRAFK